MNRARCRSSLAGLCGSLAALVLAASGCRPQPDPPATPDTIAAAAAASPQTQYFTDITTASGLEFQHVAGRAGTYFLPQIIGGGAAFLDYDRDGRLDVYFVNGNRDEGGPPTAGTRITNRLFHQRHDGRFEDVTAGSGLEDDGYGMGVAVGDVNNDGFPDVYVTNYGPDRLYLNQGNGTYRDVTQAAGIDDVRWGASACLVDFDRDGWLDLYVTNYVDYFPSRHCTTPQGLPDYCNPSVFPFAPDKLYRNQTGSSGGEVRFADVSVASGIARKQGPGLGVTAGDFNEDGWPDLFVANDGSASFLWINQQDGTFQDEAILYGVAYDGQGRPQAGMGVALDDLNGDRKPDLFVTHLGGEVNGLYMTGSSFGYAERANELGLGEPGFRYTGFGTAFVDFEHDGDLDVAVVNGRVTRPADIHEVGPGELFWSAYAEVNQLFVNDGSGRFQPVDDHEAFCVPREISRALCAGDVDNDGDMDLLVVNAAGRAALFRNDAEKSGHWLMVQAVDPACGGRDMLGARVTVRAGSRAWDRDVMPGSSYLASHDPRVHFGLGATSSVETIEVRWPDGSREQFPGGAVDRHVVLERGQGRQP